MPQTPSNRPPRSAGGIAAAATAAAVGGLFLNNRYGLSHDINELLQSRNVKKRLGARIAQLGDDVTIYRMLELAKQDAPVLWFEGRTWTYAELRSEVDLFATILHQQGVQAGDSVSVFMTNSPEMVVAYCAISSLGAVPALINAALRHETLAHCMNVAKSDLVICSPDLASHIRDLFAGSENHSRCISLNLSSFEPLQLSNEDLKATNLTQIRYEDLRRASSSSSERPRGRRTLTDVGALIYTSGTSGKPKAVSIKNFLLTVVSTPTGPDASNRKRYYPLRTFSCLPLFHATCLFTGLYYSAGSSSTFCLSRKFSARNFTRELTNSGATRMLYVGELCRYLLASPPSPYDQRHKVIVASGNGLRKDIWEPFKTRFAIPEIREFYRSTEGIAKFDNRSLNRGSAGMVGYWGPIGRYFEDDTFLVRHDATTEQPYRDPKTGFCVPAKRDEPGEAIGRVRSMALYNEYLNDPGANKLKLIENVFEKGDLFQRTGDLLVHTSEGYIRFHDRSGDTFRWRGENVSAGEVREHIAKLPNVQDVSVYGVVLAGYDGQAGVAGITLVDQTPAAVESFAKTLHKSLRRQGLTDYQLPRLVRFMAQIDTGATFKHAKEILKKRTWDPQDPAGQEDALYWLNGDVYTSLQPRDWEEIKGGRARL